MKGSFDALSIEQKINIAKWTKIILYLSTDLFMNEREEIEARETIKIIDLYLEGIIGNVKN